MPMFKRGCVALLLILASACGSSNSTTSPTPTLTPTVEVVIVSFCADFSSFTKAGATAQVTVIGIFANGTTQDATPTCTNWQSDNTSVLTANSGGLMTAQSSSGSATITTTCQQGVSARGLVTLNPTPTNPPTPKPTPTPTPTPGPAPSPTPPPTPTQTPPPTPTPTPTPPAVEYRITGTSLRGSATYQNSRGGTNQSAVNVPFSYSWNGARSGDFLYMACQIDTGGDTGSITIGLYKNGNLVQSATANGFPNIATVSGSY